MDTISLIRCEWNVYNGFVFEILTIDCMFQSWSFDGSLFGINKSKEWFMIDFLFFPITISSPIRK